jgi:hypothetical protein
MGVNGKKKGNAYERSIANLFSEEFDDNFKRVPMSGAFTGGVNIYRVQGLREDVKEGMTGDIICPKWWPATVECKHYGDEPKFHQVLEGKSKKMDEWLQQCRQEWETTTKDFYLLIFKINRKGEYVTVPYEFIPEEIIENENFMIYRQENYKYCIVTMGVFLKYKDFIAKYKEIEICHEKAEKTQEVSK